MYVSHFRRLAILFSCITLFSSTGCVDFCQMSFCPPFGGPVADDPVGVVTPAERIATLREMGENAQQSDTARANMVETLARAMESEPDMLIRSEIVRTAGNYSGEGADALLHAALSDSAAEVRIVACEALAGRGDSRSVKLLAGTLDGDTDTDVRLAAAVALGNTANQEALAALAPSLRDYDPAATAAKLDIPMLICHAGRDYQVTEVDLAGWKQALSGRPDVTIKTYPACNHLMIEGKGQITPAEYKRFGHVSAEVIGAERVSQ